MNKKLKISLGIIFLLFGLILIFSSIMPSKFKEEASININASDTLVYNTLLNLNTWSKWNELMSLDTSLRTWTVKDTISHSKTLYWNGTIASTGFITLTEQTKYSYIEVFIKFDVNGLKLTSSYQIIKGANDCLIKNVISGRIKHPIGKLLSPLAGKEITRQMSQSLKGLKEFIEKDKK